ncbi:hypothetical protein BX265_5010 [Streptomyces sp. TLI_235]|nr:helix-turn-helix domain-containing protein [Streptomyces sp. TLI_235]PBC72215.1 hypothetical protein BX265_6837 [Streptomyces sp. TLI_235]PBC80173.1 hypothetical protein BX265_5010 [Streptomyces sp. TLI_235]
MDLPETARYIKRTPKALRSLRERGGGPKGFRSGGRVLFYIADVDAWLAHGHASDRHTNPALDPTRRKPEPRRSRSRRRVRQDAAAA